MEGVWKLNPFYWVALYRLSHANNGQSSNQTLTLRAHRDMKRVLGEPMRISKRAVRVFVVSFFMIAVPIYAYIGMQPVSSIEALSYPELNIESIGLTTPVAALEMNDRQLTAPATIAGSYSNNPNKTLIIGHSSTVFENLAQVNLHDEIFYNESIYIISDITMYEKSQVDMAEILSTSDIETLVIMTCAGDPLPNQDATHRLVITATKVTSTE